MVVHYNLREQVLNDIGKQIIGGNLKPGDVLPKEDSLSQTYEVSRTVIREAIKGLAARGLVESRPKVGTIVRPRDEWRLLDPEVLEWCAATKPQNEFLLNVAEVRLVIEPATAALAARHATPEDLDLIFAACENLETAVGDESAWADADLQFHASISAACHNELLDYIVTALRKPLHSKRRINVPLVTLLNAEDVAPPYVSATDEVLSRHRAVYDAIYARDEVGARQAAFELLSRVTQLMILRE